MSANPQTPPTFFDVLNTHYNYIASLFKYSSQAPTNGLSPYLQGTNSNLQNLNTAIQSNIDSQNAVLTQQSDVIRILERENARLDQKKKSMDTVLQGQKRINDLNMSYSARYSAYNNVVIFIVIISLLIFLLFGILSKFLPPSVISGLTIIILAYAFLKLYYMLTDIWSRDKLDFNKLDSSNLITPTQAKTSSLAYNSLYGDMTDYALSQFGCTGSQCCATGTYFDISAQQCLAGTDPNQPSSSVSAFTNLEDAYLLKNVPFSLNTISESKPYQDKTKLQYDLI